MQQNVAFVFYVVPMLIMAIAHTSFSTYNILGRRNLDMYEDELERLEIRLSYLEKQNAELNEVVIDQGKTITHLLVQMEEMKKKVKDLMDVTADERANRRPPHY